ncbi:EpsG family protein [Marinomonas sp. A79]|uniref:EpsG family protein n=1 Tax=Marinomonas vulgaris TaxID=2823372 RepID=A0ABS5HD28_9GAMM|nr:EpsG family protein [Marinomonas vulgaris]MBR7889327.1 EpsG family protein [Marinomonas vulgaris]
MTDLLAIYVYPFVLVSAMLAFLGLTKGLSRYSIVGVFFIFISSVLLLLLRDPLAPADSRNYLWMYKEQKNFNNIFNAYHGNVFFSFTQYLGNLAGLSFETFFIIQTLFFYLLSFIGLRLIFQSNKMFLMSLSFFVLTSTFVFLFTNVVRQGLALSLILLAAGLFIKNYRFSGYFALFLAIFSHFSTIVVAGIFFVVRNTNINVRYVFFLILILPFVPIFSQFFLANLGVMGGFFQKIESFSSKDYNNNLVYFKVIILYFSLVVFYYIGRYRQAFNNDGYFFIFKVYMLIVFFVMFTLPVLLLSSRYLYYASALLPILYTFVLFHRPNIISIHARFYFGLLMSVVFGLFVYSFHATRMQLGI